MYSEMQRIQKEADMPYLNTLSKHPMASKEKVQLSLC
jgi:hypothetical protein